MSEQRLNDSKTRKTISSLHDILGQSNVLPLDPSLLFSAMDRKRARELVSWNSEGARKLFDKENVSSFSSIAVSPIADHSAALELKLRSKFNASFQSSLLTNLKNPDDLSREEHSVPDLAEQHQTLPAKRTRSVVDPDEAGDGVSEVNEIAKSQSLGSLRSQIETDANTRILDNVETEQAQLTARRSQRVAPGALILSDDAVLPHSSAGATALRLAQDRPQWHAPWETFRVIMGHAGWVRAVAVEPENQWFATGSADRTVKIWDLASGRLKLTLTGHVSTVRGICISERRPYMFTVGEDKMVKCWDLEHNKVVRHYHGHLSGVYTVALHPSLDVLMTGGRDSVVRVWDMRTKRQIFALSGHRDAINAVESQAADPQVISASVDTTVRLWDLAAGKCMTTLTHHKKGVRSLVLHPREFSFASASADSIRTWAFPRGDLLRNLKTHQGLVNALAINYDGVLVSGGDDGIVRFWDYSSAHCFQELRTKVQPGSMDNEAGIYAMAFDRSGSRLITCETDKTIKIWRENETATEESHPSSWQPDLRPKRY